MSQIQWACLKTHLTALARFSVLDTPHFLIPRCLPYCPLLDFLTICSLSPLTVLPPVIDYFILNSSRPDFKPLLPHTLNFLPWHQLPGFRFYLYTDKLWTPLSDMASKSFTSSHSLFCKTISSLSEQTGRGPTSITLYLHPDVWRSESQGNQFTQHLAILLTSKLLENSLGLSFWTSSSGPHCCFSSTAKD